MQSGNKNSLLDNTLVSKTNIAVLCAVGMIYGFLVSRAWSSFFVFAFGVNALWNVHPKNWLKDKWWILGATWFLLYALSYFWTADEANWQTRVEVKLPILLLPLAFYFMPAFNRKQVQFFTLCSAVLFIGSALYSLSFFLYNPAYYAEQYVYSHVLPTAVYGDHIRYSLSLSLYIVWCFSIFQNLEKKWIKTIVVLTIAFLSVYLHILAARTGLLIWYLFVSTWCLRYAFKKNLKVGLFVIIALIAVATLAAKYIPTLEKRVWYAKRTFELYQSGKLESGYSDMGRVISYKLALRLIKENALIGVGAGDILVEMNKGYDKYYPEVPNSFRLIPHNQFLIVCLGCGIFSLLVFILWIFTPLTWVLSGPGRFYAFITWLSLLLALMVEPMLEIQYGVFVFMFFLLWQRQTGRVIV